MRMMRDAMQPVLLNAYQHQRMPHQDGTAASARYHQHFFIHDRVLERVDIFKYLGCLLSQDDDDIQAVRTQIRKACTTWARVSNVPRVQNTPPWISAKFYKSGGSVVTALWQ
jgi:hypothetical protein